jgi:beta-xylosidase
MIEAVMLWNEPNNKSHWDFALDPGWERFAAMVSLAGRAVADAAPGLTRVLGGISPIDPAFLANMRGRGVLQHVDAVAVHGFPLDWNLWSIHAWPAKLAEVRAVTRLPLWVSEVGVSSFGAEEVQAWGLERTAELLLGAAPAPARVHWYSLFDLPSAWEATTRHREAEGSSYYRHFHMGLIDEHGRPKLALERFARLTPALGICQWFHWEDRRLDEAARRLADLGVRKLRTGLSWSERCRDGALDWFDRLMGVLAPFDVTVTFCFTPDHAGLAPHHTSPPRAPGEYADFCAEMVQRYARPPAPARPGAPGAPLAPGAVQRVT